MALSSPVSVYLSNLFHPATFFVLFACLLSIHFILLAVVAFAILAATLTFLLHRLTPLHPPPPHSAILLTGASSGLGQDAAIRLTTLGFKVFATTRRDHDAYRLQLRCKEHSHNLVPLTMDVTRAADVHAAYDKVRQTLQSNGWQLYAVILNAGYGEYGPLEMITADRLRQQLEVNVIAQHALAQAFIPLLRASSGFDSAAAARPPTSSSAFPLHPRLLFVSSLASRISLPGRGAYCASKAALQMLADVYRVELRAFNIEVVAITPGELSSAFHDTSKANWHRVLAETTQRALERTPPPSSSSSSTPIPAPLPLSIVNHYDRAFHLSFNRPSTTGTPDACTDAIELALRSRYPLPRYDCGDDGAVSSLLTLLPVRARDWLLGRWFMKWTVTQAGEEVVESRRGVGEEEVEAAVVEGGGGGGGGDKKKGDDKVMAAERKMAPEEETEQLTERFVIEES